MSSLIQNYRRYFIIQFGGLFSKFCSGCAMRGGKGLTLW